ncbi:MAG: hypothetical protein HY657_04445 [Acidobacteria bacterium]|nr:hypothetical protein [Acidobacteriota bacterium]
MFNRKSLAAACGAAILGLVMAASSTASTNASRRSYLTFSGPVALPGVTLRAGAYTFELADSNRRDIVQVRTRDRSRVLWMGFTRLVRRPAGLRADRPATLGEAPRGTPPPITAWYPFGEPTGYEFIYP